MRVFLFLLLVMNIPLAQERGAPFYLYKYYKDPDQRMTGRYRNSDSLNVKDFDITVLGKSEFKQISGQKYFDPNQCAAAALKSCGISTNELAVSHCTPPKNEDVAIKSEGVIAIGPDKTAALMREYQQNSSDFCRRNFRFSYDESSAQFYDNGARDSNESYLSTKDYMRCSDAQLRYLRQQIQGTPPECAQPKEDANRRSKDAMQACQNNANAILSSYFAAKNSERNVVSNCIKNFKIGDFVRGQLLQDQNVFSLGSCVCSR